MDGVTNDPKRGRYVELLYSGTTPVPRGVFWFLPLPVSSAPDPRYVFQWYFLGHGKQSFQEHHEVLSIVCAVET